MKKIIRIILTILFFIPSYPILFATYALMGIVPIMGLCVGMQIIFAFPSGNSEWVEDCKMGWLMVIYPFYAPFKEWYKYIVTGTFSLD